MHCKYFDLRGNGTLLVFELEIRVIENFLFLTSFIHLFHLKIECMADVVLTVVIFSILFGAQDREFNIVQFYSRIGEVSAAVLFHVK